MLHLGRERRRKKKSNRNINPGNGSGFGSGSGSGVIDHPIDKYGQVKLVSQVKPEKKGSFARPTPTGKTNRRTRNTDPIDATRN